MSQNYSTKISHDIIINALHEEIRTWHTQSKLALRDVEKESKYLSKIPDEFKSAAWLNFGIDATNNMFPNSLGGTVLKRLNPYIWLTSQVSNGFRSAYKSYIQEINNSLDRHYTDIRHDIDNQINYIEQGFISSQFARTMGKQIYKIIHDEKKRQFKDTSDAITHCRRTITKANIISTDSRIIHKRTQEGFGKICEKIYDIYRGSYGGHTVLVKVDPNKKRCWSWNPLPGFIFEDHLYRYDPVKQAISDCTPGATEILVHGNFKKREDLKWLLVNAWRFNIHHRDRTFPHSDVTYAWQSQSPVSLPQMAKTYTGLTTINIQDLKKAEAQIWTDYQYPLQATG